MVTHEEIITQPQVYILSIVIVNFDNTYNLQYFFGAEKFQYYQISCKYILGLFSYYTLTKCFKNHIF